MTKSKKLFWGAWLAFCAALIALTFAGAFRPSDALDYDKNENWAWYRIGEAKSADVFLICPTVDTKDENNMSMSDEKTKTNFLGALNMERGIYEPSARLYAPFYRQAAIKAYSLPEAERGPVFAKAYADVSAAFVHYLKRENNGRPIVLAGFSQGADMCYRLLEEHFRDEKLRKQLVAVYALGWPLTAEQTKRSPWIVPAKGETDTGVVVTFDCEAPEVTETFIVPAGTKSFAINPLNWRTDATSADAALNLGACFTDYSGEIKKEVPQLCGAYIDETRGVLKVPGLDASAYPPVVHGLPQGAYHVYDYMFFYRNLQKNVADRVNAWLAAQKQ